MADFDLQWYSVRCVFRAAANKPWGPHDLENGQAAYEERIRLWRAESADNAIQLAEGEARTHESQIELEYRGFAQSYRIADPNGTGWRGLLPHEEERSTTDRVPEPLL